METMVIPRVLAPFDLLLNRNLHDLRVCNFELAHGCLSKRVTTQSYNAAIFMSPCLASRNRPVVEISYESWAMLTSTDLESVIYPKPALETAGGKVTTVKAWNPNVVRDRELIPCKVTQSADCERHCNRTPLSQVERRVRSRDLPQWEKLISRRPSTLLLPEVWPAMR